MAQLENERVRTQPILGMRFGGLSTGSGDDLCLLGPCIKIRMNMPQGLCNI